MQRVAVGAAAAIRATLYGPDAEPADASGAVGVVITDTAGVVVDSGDAVKVPEAPGVYQYPLAPAITAVLGVYAGRWTGELAGTAVVVKTGYEVVGAHYFLTDELRAFDPAFADRVRYPGPRLAAARDGVCEEIECGRVAFVPRGRRVVLDGTGTPTLLLPDTRIRRLVAVIEDGVAYDAGGMGALTVSAWGVVAKPASAVWAPGSGNVAVAYEHGWDAPPERIRRAAMLLVRERLVVSAYPARATSVSCEEGTFSLATAGRSGPFGIPEVDAALAEAGDTRPRVG